MTKSCLYKTGKRIIHHVRTTYKTLANKVYDLLDNEDQVKRVDIAMGNAAKLYNEARKIKCTRELGNLIKVYQEKRQIPTFLGDKFGIDYTKQPSLDGSFEFKFTYPQKNGKQSQLSIPEQNYKH